MKGEWRCVSTMPGVLSVMMDGIPLMLMLSAVSLDSRIKVNSNWVCRFNPLHTVFFYDYRSYSKTISTFWFRNREYCEAVCEMYW